MLAAVFACKISTDLSQPVAIVMILPDSARVELTDAFRPRAAALNGAGDTVQVDIFWASLDTAVLAVVDSTTGVSVPKLVFDTLTGLPRPAGSSGRLQARTATLLSNPQAIQVLARLDAMAADTMTRDTVDAVDSLSIPLRIRTVAYGGTAVSRRVIYSFTTYPDSAPKVTLLPRDTVTTGFDGRASVQVRRNKGTWPDSVVVTAAMQTFHGDPLPGSPVTFVVEFRP